MDLEARPVEPLSVSHRPSSASNGMTLFAGGAHFTPLFMGFDYSQPPASARGAHPHGGFGAVAGTPAGAGAAAGGGDDADDEDAVVVVTDCNINSVLDNPWVRVHCVVVAAAVACVELGGCAGRGGGLTV